MPHLAARAVPAVLLVLVLSTGPAQAAQDARTRDLRSNRAAAERALTEVERLNRGVGVRTGRELTPALADLFRRLPALGAADRAIARRLMVRPTFGGTEQTADTGRFRVHWTNTTVDAPPQTDNPPNGRPDYIDAMLTAFAQVEATGERRDGVGATGVRRRRRRRCRAHRRVRARPARRPLRLRESESTASGVAAYLELDNDYSAAEFPPYGGNFLPPLQVTAAHEYNHVLQFGYDPIQDRWMFESTATWMEDKVFPAVNDYHLYMTSWAGLSALPITQFDNAKIYGSAIWNHWLDRRFGARRHPERVGGVGVRRQLRARRLRLGDQGDRPAVGVRARAHRLLGRHRRVGRAQQRDLRGPAVPDGRGAAWAACRRRRSSSITPHTRCSTSRPAERPPST